MRAASLRAGPRQPFPAEWLAFDHRANLVAIDVEIADPRMAFDIDARRVDAALEPQRKAISAGIDRRDDAIELARFPPNNVQNGAEMLAVEPAPPVESPWTLATTYDLGLALNRGH